MQQPLQALVREVRAQTPCSLERLLAHPRVKEVTRIRAHEASAFPWATIKERRSDCQRHIWDAVTAQKDARVDQLKTDGSWLAYLSTCIKYKLLRQIRTDLQLKEVVVTDNSGRKRYELAPKIVRAPFDQALKQIDPLADPLVVIARREGVMEIHDAVETAPMSLQARRVLQLRLKGMMSKDIAKEMGRTPSFVSQLLKEARRAVRDQLYRIRTGNAGRPWLRRQSDAGRSCWPESDRPQSPMAQLSELTADRVSDIRLAGCSSRLGFRVAGWLSWS